MKKLVFSFAAFAALVACDQANELKPATEREVSIVAQASETKTTLSENAVLWESGDDIKVRFDKEGEGSHFETFTTTSEGASATFTGTLPNDVSVSGGYNEVAYAVYPASAMTPDGISATLQEAVTASTTFASGDNLSSAVVSLSDLAGTGAAAAEFKNAFSIIRFTLDPGVKTLVLTANAPLVGTAAMVFDNDGRLVKSGDFTTSSTTLTVNPPAGGFVANAVYNVLVFPGSFTSLRAYMTDTDDCTFSKEVADLSFDAAKFYTFNFTNPANFDKTYSFTATGRAFTADDQIQVVVPDTHSADAVLTYADGKFTGNTTHANYEANKPGYAIYPASAYNNGNITCTLPADGTVSYPDLWAAPITLKSTTAAFTSVKEALAQLSFTVPTGVESVKITSDKGVVGAASLSVENGTFVAGAGEGKEINVASASGLYTLYVYPVGVTTLTVTLKDAAGSEVTQTLTVTLTAGGTATLALGDVSFDKEGNFTHEEFVSGGDVEF